MRITFSEGTGVNDSVFGKCQAPIQMMLEKRGEAFENNSMLGKLFKMGTSENYGDMLTSMTNMDGFDPVGENGAYPQDSFREGYQKLIVYETWKDSFAISQEIMEDSKLLDLEKQPAKFMTAYGRTREQFGNALYGAALAEAGTATFRGKVFDTKCADGQVLFYASHPSIVDPTVTQSNICSNAFSADALGRVETAMHLFKGDNGEILDVAPDTIVIPDIAELKNAVFAAIGSDKEPTTANNAFNYQYGRWNVIVDPYLNAYVAAGTQPWILLDSKYNETYGGAVWNDRIKLAVRSTIDENTDANVWRGRSRFNAGFNDWRFAMAGGISGASAL